MKEKKISKRSIAKKYHIPEHTFRDIVSHTREICPLTGYPKIIGRYRPKTFTDREAMVSFI